MVGPIAYASRSVRPFFSVRRLRRPNLTFGKLPLEMIYIWKVSTWQIVTWEVTLGKMPLGKYLTPLMNPVFLWPSVYMGPSMQQTQAVRENICVFFPEGLSNLDFLSEIIKYWLTFWGKKKNDKNHCFFGYRSITWITSRSSARRCPWNFQTAFKSKICF